MQMVRPRATPGQDNLLADTVSFIVFILHKGFKGQLSLCVCVCVCWGKQQPTSCVLKWLNDGSETREDRRALVCGFSSARGRAGVVHSASTSRKPVPLETDGKGSDWCTREAQPSPGLPQTAPR